MWTADDYRDAARSANHRDTRRALLDEADRRDRIEATHRASTRVEVVIRVESSRPNSD